MRIKSLNLSQEQLDSIYLSSKEQAKIVCYPELTYVEQNIVFPPKSIVVVDDLIFQEGVINKLCYDESQSLFILYDAYDNVIMAIQDKGNTHLIVNQEESTFSIRVEDRIDGNLEYPIFSRTIDVENGVNTGTLYVRFSPVTTEEKYIIYKVTGSTNYINSVFDIFEEDSKYCMLFNYLGIGIGDVLIKVTKDMKAKDILLMYKLNDYNVELISVDGNKYHLSYAGIVHPQEDVDYIIAKNNYLIYNEDSQFTSAEVDENITNELASITDMELKYHYLSKEFVDILSVYNENSEIDDETREEYNVKTMIGVSIYDKLSPMELFKTYDGLVYIDKNKDIFIIDNLDQFNENINRMLELVK